MCQSIADRSFLGTLRRGNKGYLKNSEVHCPFVEPQTTSGEVGAKLKILGADLTGASSVMFNGIEAEFTVGDTGTAITATVPVGAATGPIQVVTPRGTLSSNVPFRVLP
jgi:IPT/TIG domain